ncbi:hypothetical protein KR51_00002190 [Rubidibacter lacunae KORDI 51-2]|uniref:Uncharacterized protein n=1 Tax=Rubidibacter lacunae KORDI 51-2 TaxID=582515 RepID=U5DML9_9CHRO|nr:hypothetical protein KR51_00002190 [Rubidibacter lacunae KORDI 51-2]
MLNGRDSAPVEQCLEMLDELDDFNHHTEILGVTYDYSNWIAQCHVHYSTYAKYLTVRRGASCYEDYLSLFSDA